MEAEGLVTFRIKPRFLFAEERNRKLRNRDLQGWRNRTGFDIKNNGKEERARFARDREAQGALGKKARNKLTMKLQCNDLTAVFHLARLYVVLRPRMKFSPVEIYLRSLLLK